MTTRIGRTIIATLVALSVATLPVASGFAAVTKTALEVSASLAMPDCDHHQHKAPGGKTQKTADDGACMASCALNCFNFTAAGFSGIVFSSSASAALKPVHASNIFASLLGSPPFRPPRS
jgi:hypothetical protein